MKKNSLLNRILSGILALIMVIGMCPQVAFAAELADSVESSISNLLSFHQVHGVDANVRLPQSMVNQDKEEVPYADTDVVRVSIVLNKAATLELFPTADIATNAGAMAYRDQLQKDQETIVARIESQVLKGESLDVVWNLTLAANIISANVLYGQIEKIAAIRGVKDVYLENQYAPMESDGKTADPMMSTSTQMTGSTAAWAAGYTGAGSRIAIIDTGLDLDHQSFDNGAYLYALEQNAAAKNMTVEEYMASLDLLTAEDVADVLQDLNIYPFIQHLSGSKNGAYYFNEKVPFGINYVDRDFDVTHDNDLQGGHGSHVAGIAGANRYIPAADGYASAMKEVSMQGVAPDAQLIIMKVFGKSGGAYDADYMVAIEDAIMLGCDVVNLSLGTDKGFARHSLYQDILDSLAENDVIVAVAAGNSGYWSEYGYSGTGHLYVEDVDYGMVATPAAGANTLAVGSAENTGLTNYYIQVGDQVIFYEKSQYTDYTQVPDLTRVPGNVNYIYIDGIGTAEEVAAVVEAEGGSIAPNTVFVCARGTINFAEKANNAISNGFIATIVYNNVDGLLIMNMDGYEYPEIPAVSLSLIDGMKLKDAAEAVTGENGAQYYKGSMYISDKVTSVMGDGNYQMSSFSSWGVPGNLTLKPEIVAPGGNIYSVDGEDPSGKGYYNNSGTSMASPQIAGMAALAMQYIKETGLDVKLGITSRKLATSLLMSTAQPMMDGDNYYPVLQQGAGLANLASMLLSQSYILMDENATASAADGKIKVELGDDPDRTGAYTFSFTLNNFGEAAQVFSISADFFTQATYVSNGITYADITTTPLNMAVDYTIEGGYIDASEAYACDLNGDGVTDAKDAQIILEYVAGNLTTIDQMADVSDNGTVSSYDAHLLLASIGSGYFLVQPGDTVTITVSMNLTESAKAHLDSVYTNGAYVEGFVSVQPLVTEEGETLPTHSIPVLGFYGNWSDASMYDRANYEDYLYATENGTDFVFPYTGNLNYLTFFDEEDYELTYVGNPYVVEDVFPAHKTAIRPTMEIGDMASSLLRNAAMMFFVMDEDGNVVDYVSDDQIQAAYYYQNAQYWTNVNQAGLSIWMTPEEIGGFQEGDRFTIGFFCVPEYYETDGPLTDRDLLALMNSGKIGPGAYHTYSFTVDGTAPELLNVEKLADGDLKITAKDNQYVAAVAVLTASGAQALTISAVDQDEANTVTETIIDMEDIRVNRKCLIMVADYAGNEVFYELTYNDGLADFEGRMYGFTNTKTLGADNSWLEINPENLYYDGGDGAQEIDPSYGGTMDVANMDFAVIAAEYVGGFVYMITERNELRVAMQGEWESSLLAAIDPAYGKIKDLAFNTSDNKLYALDANNTIYTVDLYTGALEKQYTVSISAPEGTNENGVTKTFTAENEKLLTLAIDDEGNFYSINNGDSTYQRVYLYTWSAEDVNNGAVSNLTPVNNTYYGYAGDYVYSDDIPATGDPTIQSMAWDHDNDILYWAAAVNAVSPYNYLYSFDLTTGKATIVMGDPIPGVADYCMGCLCANVSGLYIVPKESIELEVDTIASELILGNESLELLVGSQYQMHYDVLPWNLENKELNWITSDASVVTVDAAGNIIAVSAGTATITATTASLPHLAASCTVTVRDIQDVELNGMLYNTDGDIEWVNFNLLDAENWTSNFVTEGYQFLAGGLHRDVLYVHDGYNMYGVDANNFEVTNYGYLHETWLWSDAATGPKTPDGFFDRLVGIINGGMCIGVMDVENGMGYEVTHYSAFSDDPAALIAYVGSTTIHDGFAMRYGHEYYIMTEGGELYHDILYAFDDPDLGVVYSDQLTHIGSTGLNLSGMGNATGPNSGSMYYDIENNYLIVTAYRSGDESAAVYVFQPEVCAPVEVGSFGVDTWPVISLYSYSALNDLFVTVKPDQAEVYVDETVQLTAKVYLAVSDHGVTWSSSDETIATVNRNGLVTALKPGTVTITATSNEFNDAHEKVTASATITFKPLDSMDLMFHAYIQTEEGGKWVAIDGNTMNFAEMASSDAFYTGALVSEGIIYATDDTYYYAIDPSGNAYAVTQGDNYTDGDGESFMYMLDGTAAPVQTINMYDFGTGRRAETEVGGMPVYISGFNGGGYYFTLLEDYTTGEFLVTALDASQCPAGITHYKSEELEGYWFEFYYVLGYDGFLQTYSLYYAMENGEVFPVSGGWEVDYVPTGLVFDDGDDVSITYVETDTFTGVVIAHGTENGVEFYSYDVNERKLGKLGVLEGATDLVGLSLIDGLDVTVPEMPDPEQPVEPEEVDYLYGYIKTVTGYEWVRINPKTLEYETLKQDNTGYVAGGVLNGEIITVTGVSKYGNTTYSYQLLDPTNDYAMNPTGGSTAYANYHPADFSGVPSTQVTMIDATTGATVTKTMGGYIVHISNGNYSSSKPMTFMLTNYTASATELYTGSSTFATKLAGIVYVGSELSADSKAYYDNFLILDQQGNLYSYRLTSNVQNGKVTLNSGLQPVVTKLDVKLNLTATSGASMTRMTENLVYITVNGTAGVELYSFDLTTNTLEALGTIEGAQTLAILHTDAELTGMFETDEPTEPEQPECEHGDVNDWEYDENGHWTTCAECGEIVDQGEHVYEEGVCFCGYADPNYHPEQPEQPIGTLLHAYVKTESGYAWVKIDSATGAYVVLAEGDTEYFGAGLDGDKLYASMLTDNPSYTEGNVINLIDVANGYTATTNGRGDTAYLAMSDLTASPIKTVTVNGVETTVGVPVYVGEDSSYIVFMSDYARRTGKEQVDLNGVTGTMAIAFVSAVTAADGSSHIENYVVLCKDGTMYNVEVKFAYNPDYYSVQRAVSVGTNVSTGLDASMGASMTLAAENELYISINTASGVELYSYDLTTNTATKLSTIANAETLVGLSLLSEVRPDLVPSEPEEPECEHSDVNDWEYDENGHWTTCAECGEIVDQGEHVYEEGVCFCGYADPNYQPEEPECDHIEVSKWQYSDDTHWQICADCGEVVNRGEHSFVNGYCTVCSRLCDHTDLGEWNYYENNHWQYCACGEMVNYGPHEFKNGACVCGVLCPHTSTGAWESDENGHWKICICGDKVNEGAHSFNNGKCICGYTDPNYQAPEQPADTNNWLHAYVQTADGYAWVMINSATGEYEVLAEGAAKYDGGGYANGKIYTTVTEYGTPTVYEIDPANGYAAVQGFADDYNYVQILDVTGGTTKIVQLGGANVQVGLPVYIGWSGDYYTNYLAVVFDPATRGNNRFIEEYFDSRAIAIAYVSGEMAADGASYVEKYVILCRDGSLFDYTLTYTASGKFGMAGARGTAVQTGLTATSASMTLVGENELRIALTTASGVELYSYDLAANTATRLADVDGIQSLIGLNLLSEVRPELVPEEPEQPEQPEQPVTGAMLHAYVKTESGYAWVKIDPTTGAYEVLAEGNTEYGGAAVSEGKIYASGVDPRKYYLIDPANGYSATQGNSVRFISGPFDGTAAPTVQTVTLADNTEITVGVPVHLGKTSAGQCGMTFVYKYTSSMTNILAYPENGSFNMTALAYQSGAMAADATYYQENYWVLCEDGKLHNATVKHIGAKKYSITMDDGVETGLTNVVSGASMTLVAEDLLYISVNTEDGVKLYSFNVSTNVLTEMSTVTGAQTLIGLSLLSDVQPEQDAQATNQVTGSLMSVQTVTGSFTTGNESIHEDVYIADGTVQFHLAETENVTNGMLVVTFDADVLTYQDFTSAAVSFAINTSEAAEGKLIIAYASGSAISAGDILATLTFTYTGDEVDTEITVSTAQRNDNDLVSDEVTVITVSNVVPHVEGEVVIENEVEATCTEDGSYDKVIYCTECGEELSRETVIVPATGHTEGEVVIENEVEATCTTAGSYDEVVYCTECGEELSRETVTVPATGHTEGEVVIENEVEATCTEDGSYDEVVYCTECGEELSREIVTVPAHGHNIVDGKCTECDYCEYIVGDVNGDGLVDTTDAKLIMQLDLDLITENDLIMEAADVNGDGLVDTTDAKLIMQLDLGLITEFPNNG